MCYIDGNYIRFCSVYWWLLPLLLVLSSYNTPILLIPMRMKKTIFSNERRR